MRSPLSRIRRFALATIALTVSAVVFRGQIAEALVIRGDDYLLRGQRAQALAHYRRALWLSPLTESAADRYVFITMQTGGAKALAIALRTATQYLQRRPEDALLLNDRALCYLHLHHYRLAERDFERSAEATHLASTYVFAGWSAQRAGNRTKALELWHSALRAQPNYVPARVALEGEGR